MYKTILVAVDGSPQTASVLAEAADLARTQSAEVHVICVNDAARYWELGASGPAPAVFDVLDQSQFDCLDKAQRFLRQQEIACQSHAPSGMPSEEISRVARQIGASLIVIGHRHLSWLSRLMVESVGRNLLADAPCSVLVVIETGEKESHLR